ncbi:hypothetical protein [uncultured Phenylobacterium sp.]|uniref:hypothetical protein n=1 Tax=uncultured Phenylobacterium sp. TaxID=349273 RepID=UPI0025D6B583|nr:hypothetical protein [uncultured Phenylobacterium sp.]
MKNLIGSLLAAVAIGAVASPAFAHQDDGYDDRDRHGGFSQHGGYHNFDDLYRQDRQRIQHGLRDGSYTPQQARYFTMKLRDIRQLEASYRSRDGRLSPQEGRYIRSRLQRLHEAMHQAHNDGHARQDDGYGLRGYSRR